MHMRTVLALLTGVALVSCTPAEEEPAAETEGTEAEPAGAEDGADNVPESFAETAWISRSEEGARFVTYFDADGTYRELRNGDPRQTGEWSFAEGPEGKQICVQPDAGAGEKSCWQPDRMKDGKLIVTGPEGKRVELQRADYSATGTEDTAAQ